MDRARSIRSAAYLTVTLLLALISIAPLASAQSSKKSTTAKKKTTATAASKRTTAKTSKNTVAASRHTRTSPSAESATKRVTTRKVVVTRKLVHGHWVRTTQVVHAPPAPSYQTHPDPERYQQIQQALATSGYFKGEVNGVWGDDSVAALKQFQTDHKLVNDGKISSLSLIGLGLGPNRETANATPAAPPPPAVPPQN